MGKHSEKTDKHIKLSAGAVDFKMINSKTRTLCLKPKSSPTFPGDLVIFAACAGRSPYRMCNALGAMWTVHVHSAL